jgi:hypothetical protein
MTKLSDLPIQITDITEPVAQKDFECCWPHDPAFIIRKGRKYVRVTYKDKRTGKFESDHICVDCWAK